MTVPDNVKAFDTTSGRSPWQRRVGHAGLDDWPNDVDVVAGRVTVAGASQVRHVGRGGALDYDATLHTVVSLAVPNAPGTMSAEVLAKIAKEKALNDALTAELKSVMEEFKQGWVPAKPAAQPAQPQKA